MATLTSTGSLNTLFATNFSVFWDAYEAAANTYCETTFDAINLFSSSSDFVFDSGYPTSTVIHGHSPSALGTLVLLGTGLNSNASGTISSVDFTSDSGDSFVLTGSAHWVYDQGFDTGGLGSVTIHHGTDVLTITSTSKNLVPDDTDGEFRGIANTLTLTTGGVTVSLKGAFDVADLTGTLTSVSIQDGSDSVTVTGATIDAPTFFALTTVGDIFTTQTFFTGNDIFTINDTSALAWHGYNGADKLTGGANSDTLFGDAGIDALIGLGGNDTLDGGTGADVMTGGLGDDYYFADNSLDKAVELLGGGHDTVEATASYVLGAYVDDLLLAGSSDINGTGNTLANVIAGNSGDNTLSGGVGADTMIGNGGDDTFFVDNAGDTVTASSGNDTVIVTRTNASLVTPITIHTADFTSVENLKVTGTGLFNLEGDSGDNILTGNGSVNILTGFGGHDTLDGGLGADTMIGGNNDDTYILDSAGDTITDTGGTDTLIVKLGSGTYTLGADFENLTLFGIASANITGNDGVNILTGSTGNNTLDGGLGADSMIGGLGNDTYIIDDAGDTVTEDSAGGTDSIKSSLSFDLNADGGNVEKLTLAALAGNIDGTGNALTNIITGNEGNNTLDGGLGTGIDTLIGGTGDDTYLVDLVKVSGIVKLMALITEVAGAPGGIDTLVVRSGDLALTTAINGGLSTNLENLDISQTGSNLLNLTGNASNNTLTGNDADNTLNGLAGADNMYGGNGNDTYIFDSAGDVAHESSGGNAGDSDTVVIAYATAAPADLDVADYANIENLKVTGSGLYNLIGDSNANILTGNASVNSMTGGDGDDTYFVGAGDVVIETPTGGTDTVMSAITWTLGSNIEKLTLTGASSVNGTGNDLDNTITGNSGANILDGGAGAGSDSLIGGAGNDTYIVHSVSDVITELTGGGTDTVKTYVDYTLATSPNVENISVLGSTGCNIEGNNLNNILTGSSGDDVLDGAAGADKLAGGLGNDKYYVDNTGDVIAESSSLGGTDLVSSSVNWTLGSNLENLTLASTAVVGIGNTLNNTLTGNASGNTLNGVAGNDTLIGGDGLDTLIGGTGTDTFVFDHLTAYNNVDVVTDFSRTLGDHLNISDLLTGYNPGIDVLSDFVHLTQNGLNTDVSIDANGTSGGVNFVQIATLLNTSGLTDAAALVLDGTLVIA
ncbi:MAG: calcium-binding protein [Alphaproteobacteria bacterium]|nr:MAG: calcium-binding protein [Alphaproteobacteria bacterium]